MSLPIGAGNSVNSIPFALPNNAARPSARDTRYSSAKTSTSDQISDGHLAIFMAADSRYISGTYEALDNMSNMSGSGPSPLIHVLLNALENGNPEGKTLQDLTLILKSTFRANIGSDCRQILLMKERGQIIIRPRVWGRGIKICSRATHNYQEFKKEKYAEFTDALTLSVLRTLYKQSTIDNFLLRRGAVISDEP